MQAGLSMAASERLFRCRPIDIAGRMRDFGTRNVAAGPSGRIACLLSPPPAPYDLWIGEAAHAVFPGRLWLIEHKRAISTIIQW